MARSQGSVKQITSLVLTRYCFNFPFLGQAETVVKLGIKSHFGDVGLSLSDSILHFFFNSSFHIKICLDICSLAVSRSHFG